MPKYHCCIPGCHESRKWLTSSKLEGARAESIHCSRHACRTLEGYPNAIPCSNIAIPGTRYCAIHPSCTFLDCNHQRSPNNQFCHNHTCAVLNCPNVATSPNRRCEVHMPCPVHGCPRFLLRRPDGLGWYGACRVHVAKRCDFAGCSTKVGLTDTYCADHICTVKGCPERKVSGSSNCQNHTCAANECRLPVAHPEEVRPNHRACAYCLVHECHTENCHIIATIVGGHCPTHGCKVRGCDNAKSPDDSLGGYCFTHISTEMYRRAERAGRNAEYNDAIERREKEMDRQRELERIQREQDNLLRLEEEVESLKLENLRLQVENASVAEHYTADQHSHRHSPESPRSGSFRFDNPRSSFSHHRRIGDPIYSIPRSRGYDDDNESAVSGSTDDIPILPRRTTSIRYVRR